MADAEHTSHAGRTIRVSITPTVQQDYRRRNVFPDLRPERATGHWRASIHEVTLDQAHAILADACEQASNRELPRGVPKAYTSLKENIEGAIKEEAFRGLLPDPGLSWAVHEAQERAHAFCFQRGQAVIFRDRSFGRDDVLCEVVGDYGTHAVGCRDGGYFDKDGNRFRYSRGYLVKAPGDRRFFAFAYQLLDTDSRVRHVALVVA